MTREQVLAIAESILATRYPGSVLAFASGSYFRGEATSTSDLDFIVLFETLPQAFRESFYWEGLPVEAFVHDPETLASFCWQMDRVEGRPSLPTMILDGVPLPSATSLAEELTTMAQAVMAAGPLPLTTEAIQRRRYHLGDLLDDLRAPRSKAERVAVGTVLYGELADFYLRQKGLYSAVSKWIPRRLAQVDRDFGDRYQAAFERLFCEGEATEVEAIAADILAPVGGTLFADYRLDAPPEWRQKGPAGA